MLMLKDATRYRITISIHTAILAITVFAIACESRNAADAGLAMHRLLPLLGETVFAYARISGTGRYLAYSFSGEADDEGNTKDGRRLRVVDLLNQRFIYEDFGIDGYWSPDGSRLIYKARRPDGFHVAIWNRNTRQLTLDVFPTALGDYFSWGGHSAGETIMTIDGWYLALTSETTVGSPQRMPSCPEIGRGARPLISRDGTRASVFVGDQLVVRNVRDCDDIVFTGLAGAKADFSPNGRYLAFHAANAKQTYDIGVYDTYTGSYGAITTPEASNFFPSWTDDNALVFRHDGADYRGFVRVDDPVTTRVSKRPIARRLMQVNERIVKWQPFLPRRRCVVVLLWAAWGAHSYDALTSFEVSQRTPIDCAFITVHDPTSTSEAVEQILTAAHYHGTTVRAPWNAIGDVGGFNQTPTYLLFQSGRFSDRFLGALGADELQAWLQSTALLSSGRRPALMPESD